MATLSIKNRLEKLENMLLADSLMNHERIRQMTFAEFILFKHTGDPGRYSTEEWEKWFWMYFGDIYLKENGLS